MGWECSVCRTAAAGLPTPGYTHDAGCLRAPGPSELARELSQAAASAAEEIGDFCIERPYRNYMLTLAAQIIQRAIDHELAKVHAIPAETLDQIEKAMEEVQAQAVLDRIDLGDEWGCTPQRLAGLKALSAALKSLRAARSEKSR